MNRFSKLAIVGLLASCGVANYSAPRNLDNACAIAAERPAYMRAMKKAERRWGVPVAVQMATIYQESKFVGDARTPLQFVVGVIPMGRQSSAFGYAQALDATWDEYRDENASHRAKRDRIQDATDFMGWYMNKTRERNGIPLWDAERQYLAYHEGHTGYARASYNTKPWLVRVARSVGDRATLYNAQLKRCRKI